MGQVQMRDVQGFQETRHQLLTLKPTHRQHWMAYAIAQHLNGSCDLAVQVLNTYEGTIEGEIPASEKYEHSEMLLYRSSILEEEGKAQAALAELEKEQEVRRPLAPLGFPCPQLVVPHADVGGKLIRGIERACIEKTSSILEPIRPPPWRCESVMEREHRA